MTGSIVLSEENFSYINGFNSATAVAPFNRLVANTRNMNLTDKKKIGLKKLTIAYSWPNITNATSITIAWRIGGSYTNYTWTLPALTNYKSIDVLNQALQSFCIATGLYLVNSLGDNVYYLQLQANEVTYKVDLTLFKVPTSLPASWTQPANFVGYPSVSVTPRFTIPTDSEMISLIGFPANTYDGNTTDTVFSSQYVPIISPVSAVFVLCNIAKNDTPLNGSTVISVFTTSNTEYGATIVVEPNEISYYDIDSNSTNLEIQFLDQKYRPLYVKEPAVVVHLEVV